jgi:hypothetical protein
MRRLLLTPTGQHKDSQGDGAIHGWLHNEAF